MFKRKESKIRSAMSGRAYKSLYVYFYTYSFWKGYIYFVSEGHIEEGFWKTEKQLENLK